MENQHGHGVCWTTGMYVHRKRTHTEEENSQGSQPLVSEEAYSTGNLSITPFAVRDTFRRYEVALESNRNSSRYFYILLIYTKRIRSE